MLREYIAFLTDSEEDEESELLNLRSVRRNLRDFSDPFTLTDQSFIQRFRLNKIAFKYVLDNIRITTGTRVTYIPPILRLCSTLEVLGGGSYQWSVGNDFVCPLAQSTLSKVFGEYLKSLEDQICPKWIKWSSDSEEDETKSYFFNKYKIPGVIGCVDGTQISLIRPTENEEMFYNRKGYHSINTMIINDHKYRIIAVSAKYGGAAHDSFVWSSSGIKNKLESRYNQRIRRYSKLLGDSGYPLEPWLLTPYRKARCHDEIHFKTVHARARNINERCIGILKGRWRCLLLERKSRYSPKKVSQCVNVCAALHNICIYYKVPVFETITEDDAQYHWEGEDSNRLSLKKAAEKIRNRIKRSLVQRT